MLHLKFTKIVLLAFAMLSFSTVFANTIAEFVEVEMSFFRIVDDIDCIGDNTPIRRTPARIPCPVSVAYDASSNTFYLVSNDALTVGYTIYNETGAQLQSGTATVGSGHTSVPVVGMVLTDGCMIELTIGDYSFIGEVNL